MNTPPIDSTVQKGSFICPELDLLVFRSKAGNAEVWVAQCLQYDICVQAGTLPELEQRIDRAVLGTAILAQEAGKVPFADLPPAPQAFWKAHKSAEPLGRGFDISETPDLLPRNLKVEPPDYVRFKASSRLTDGFNLVQSYQ